MLIHFCFTRFSRKASGLLLLLFAGSLFAGTATTTFTVTATVAATCSITANNLNFGTYNPTLGQILPGTTTLSVTCTNTSPYNVGLDQGTGSSATVASRVMTQQPSGSNTIKYTLYQDSARLTVWGNTVGTDTVAGTGTGSAQILTVYGLIFASNPTTIPAATYQDTITATVTF